jgi:xylulokinase
VVNLLWMTIYSEERVVLAVDLGTGGPKIGFVALDGRIVWSVHVPITTAYPGRGSAVQDPDAWWDAILTVVRRALTDGVISADRIAAVSCTGQWSSTVPVDESGKSVGDCLMWMDVRGTDHVRKAVGGRVAGYAPHAAFRWLYRTGRLPDIDGADPLGHILYIENDQPEIAKRARWYLEPVDYLTMRFTGVASASPASMLATYVIDNRRHGVAEYDAQLTRSIGIPIDKLPPLRPTGSVVGVVCTEVAAKIGLRDDVQVITGVPDLHSATVGSGSVADYESHLALSTTSWVSAPLPFRKTKPFGQIASVAGLRPDRYLVVDTQAAAGICFQWLRDNIAAPDDGLLPTGDIAFEELTELAGHIPPGSHKVLFSPWLFGQRTPHNYPYARAGFHNLSLRTTRSHLARAVLEGVAFGSRYLIESVERFAGRQLEQTRVIGGGALSDLWCQIHADVCDRQFARVVDPVNASLRGSGLLAAIALGEVKNHEIRDLVPVDRVFEPDPTSHAVYQSLFEEIRGLDSTQRSMFRRLNQKR